MVKKDFGYLERILSFIKLGEVRVLMQITVEEITIPFDNHIMERWRMRDPLVVPKERLEWRGPGIENSFGFGEWLAGNYFREQGYHVIDSGYNLVSKTSKFKENNDVIASIVGRDALQLFKTAVQSYLGKGCKITSDLDLFIYKDDASYFVDAKKGADRLRLNQIHFMYLAKKILGIDSKVAYLDHRSVQKSVRQVTYDIKLF